MIEEFSIASDHLLEKKILPAQVMLAQNSPVFLLRPYEPGRREKDVCTREKSFSVMHCGGLEVEMVPLQV